MDCLQTLDLPGVHFICQFAISSEQTASLMLFLPILTLSQSGSFLFLNQFFLFCSSRSPPLCLPPPQTLMNPLWYPLFVFAFSSAFQEDVVLLFLVGFQQTQEQLLRVDVVGTYSQILEL